MVLLGESASRKEPGSSAAAASDSARADSAATTPAGSPAPESRASTEHTP